MGTQTSILLIGQENNLNRSLINLFLEEYSIDKLNIDILEESSNLPILKLLFSHYDVMLLNTQGSQYNYKYYISAVLSTNKSTRLIVIDDYLEEDYVEAYFSEGARGYIQLTKIKEQLPLAINAIRNGGVYNSHSIVTN